MLISTGFTARASLGARRVPGGFGREANLRDRMSQTHCIKHLLNFRPELYIVVKTFWFRSEWLLFHSYRCAPVTTLNVITSVIPEFSKIL